MIIQHQMVSPENILTSNIVHTDEVTFRNMYVYTCTYMHIKANEKRAMNLKENKGGYIGRVSLATVLLL